MAIERVFAIEGTPEAVWDALWADLQGGDANAYTVEHANRPHGLGLRLALAGFDSRLTYSVETHDSGSIVTATLAPHGIRYALYQVITFGHTRTNLQMLLTIALSNLKDAVEGREESTTD